jgi:hypothetical protein
MNKGQNGITNFSNERYNKSKLKEKVPLYSLFETIDDTVFEVFNR